MERQPLGHLLLVEDDELSARALIRLRVHQGLEVCWTRSVVQTRAVLEARHAPWEYALVDDHLLDGMGLELLPLLRQLDPPPAVVLVTAFYTVRRAHEAFRCGALLLSKPSSSAALVELLAALRPAAGGELATLPYRPAAPVDQQVFGRFVLDAQGLFTPTELVPLRAAERRLLAFLLHRAPQIASSAEIARALLGRRDQAAPTAVRRQVSNLRSGLGLYTWLVETVEGKGYRLAARALAHDAARQVREP